LIKTN